MQSLFEMEFKNEKYYSSAFFPRWKLLLIPRKWQYIEVGNWILFSKSRI